MVVGVFGVLILLMGFLIAGIGLLAARRGFHKALRSHRKTTSYSTATIHGWDSWFVGGFAGTSHGHRWLRAVLAGVAGVVVGAGLIGLSLQVFEHL